MLSSVVRESYVLALQMIDEIVTKNELSKLIPESNYHYSSISNCLNIAQTQKIRLSHCEYMNDVDEIKHSIRLVENELGSRIGSVYTLADEKAFYEEVRKSFINRSSTYEAFVFCMSEGDTTRINDRQDVLSMWRAYGRNGKGACVSIGSRTFLSLENNKSIRFSRVIYEAAKQRSVVEEIVHMGWRLSRTSPSPRDAVEATAVSLVFFMPIMKNEHFSEEREWRLIYVPEPAERGNLSRSVYENSSGLLVPYYELGADDNIDVAVQEIMVGPSSIQELNVSALNSVTKFIFISNSHIPYRV